MRIQLITACGKYCKKVYKTCITDLELSTTPLTDGCHNEDVIQLVPLRSQSLFQFVQISDAYFSHLRKPIGGFLSDPLGPTSYLAPYWRFMMPKFCDLDLRRFNVIQGQRSWCQSKAHRRFRIWPPLSPTSYLSTFSRYLTLKIFFHMFFHRNNRED